VGGGAGVVASGLLVRPPTPGNRRPAEALPSDRVPEVAQLEAA